MNEICVRDRTQVNEKITLSKRAALSENSRGRLREEADCPLRTCYQRDRDRVIHAKAFRRLKHKTQVFLTPEGDHYRTRLTHTLEVAQIARTIARAMALNEDLTEAIALGHDLGHTPFGHAGERALDDVFPEGFRHYEQSLRIVDKLEKNGRGLNLTMEVRNGIERHTNGDRAFTLEGQIVRVADRIAYLNHDIEDAFRAGILDPAELPKEVRETLGDSKSERINTLVMSVVESSNHIIRMDEETAETFDLLNTFMFNRVYTNPDCKSEESKAIELVQTLYWHFHDHPDQMPLEYKKIIEEEGAPRAACDYIAGMSDRFAVQTFQQIFIPLSWDKF